MILNLIAQATQTPEDVFGTITAPQGIAELNEAAGGPDAIGALIFISRIVQFIYVIAGLFILFNFITAGMSLVTSEGDAKAKDTARTKITYSIIGLVIIVASLFILSLLGFIFFGEATFFIVPNLTGPEASTT